MRVAKETEKGKEKALFTGIRGERIDAAWVGNIVKKYGIKCGVGTDLLSPAWWKAIPQRIVWLSV